jgi:MoxR-like ATPase
LREAISDAARGLVERESLVEMIALSAVAREHMLVIGPPGTAKSEAVRRVAHATGGRYFEYLLGRFTEPSDIFGPVDLRRLKDRVERRRALTNLTRWQMPLKRSTGDSRMGRNNVCFSA